MTQTNSPQKFSYYWLATIFLVLVVVVGLITATAAGMRATIKIDTTTPIATKNENWQIKFEDEKLSVEPSNLNFQPISVEVSKTESFKAKKKTVLRAENLP